MAICTYCQYCSKSEARTCSCDWSQPAKCRRGRMGHDWLFYFLSDSDECLNGSSENAATDLKISCLTSRSGWIMSYKCSHSLSWWNSIQQWTIQIEPNVVEATGMWILVIWLFYVLVNNDKSVEVGMVEGSLVNSLEDLDKDGPEQPRFSLKSPQHCIIVWLGDDL